MRIAVGLRNRGDDREIDRLADEIYLNADNPY